MISRIRKLIVTLTMKNDLTCFWAFLPCAKGHAKLIDEFHVNRNASHCSTSKHEKIKFHQLDVECHDCLDFFYLIMIAAATKTQCHMPNLRLRRRSNGRRECPNFGKHIARNALKEFVAVAPYCFCNNKGLCTDEIENHWTCVCLYFKNAMKKDN